ncbi:MAG: STAS domain-containing protein [Bacteroidales bacterium]
MIQVLQRKDTPVVVFNGVFRLNSHVALSIQDELLDLCKDNSVVILDLSEIKFIDSAGFGMLISVLKKAEEYKSQLVFCEITPMLADLIDVMQLRNICNIVPTVEDALNSA